MKGFTGKRLSVVLVILSVLMVSGCIRSAAFRRDQGERTYAASDPPSYYNKTGEDKSPTQRIEMMGQPKKRVAVLDFWNDTPVQHGDLGTFAADELRRGLYVTKRLVLPPDVKTEMKTEEFLQGEQVRTAQLIREGRRLGATVMVIGRVTKAVFRQRGDEVGLFRQRQSLAGVDVEVKLFDIPNGRELVAVGKSGEASSNNIAINTEGLESQEFRGEMLKLAIRDAVATITPNVIKAVEKLIWEGRIAKISGNKIYVNAGRASGLLSGDILKVLSQGDDIYDPVSGAYLGRTPGQLKGTLEVTDFMGTDASITTLHTGGNFQEGDIVRLY